MILYVLIIIFIIILVISIAGVLYVYIQNQKRKNGEDSTEATKSKNSQARLQGIESMSKFLAFDEIVDSMIVRKKGEQYIMVIQCKGINYDLLGEEEKIAVERGFIEFLNILRFPIQLYVQTRSIDLKGNIEQYDQRINDIKQDIIRIDAQIKKEQANGRLDLVRRLEFDRKRKMNILEYGTDITNYISRMSQNRDVLQQNTYVVLSYYKSEYGSGVENYSKEEIDNIAFSELYTRAQTLIRGLSASGVSGRVINSEELAELLYVAYNRDDSELINIRKSVDAQYDSLYNTAKDVLDKQKEIIESKIDQEAIELTANSIKEADRIRKLRQENQEKIKKRALEYADYYKNEMTDDLYNETKRQIEKADLVTDKEKTQEEIMQERKERIKQKKLNEKRAMIQEKRKEAIRAENDVNNSSTTIRRKVNSTTDTNTRIKTQKTASQQEKVQKVAKSPEKVVTKRVSH